MKTVLDTDVIVDYLRTRAGFLPELMGLMREGRAELVIASVSVLELYSGIVLQKNRRVFIEVLSNFTVASLDESLAEFCGQMKSEYKLNISWPDLIVGGTSVWLKAELATRNKKHFGLIPGVRFWKG